MSDDYWKWFSPPIPVKTGTVGRTRNGNSVRGALEQLRAWNRTDDKAWRKAFELCVAALEGSEATDRAVKAFAAAAKSTGNLLEREP